MAELSLMFLLGTLFGGLIVWLIFQIAYDFGIIQYVGRR